MLSRDEILAIEDRPTRDVEVPEWGGTVRIRAVSGSEMEQLFNVSLTNGRAANMQAWMAVKSVCDEDGKRIFRDEDVGSVGAKGYSALRRIGEAFIELNRMSKEQVDELEGNLPGTTPSGSG